MTHTSGSSIEMRAGDLRLALRPDLGGCIAGLWLGELPVMRSADPAALASVRDSASYPMVPYSNRLGYRRFQWLGQAYTTVENFPDMPHSLHGVAWQRPWTVVSQSDGEAVLAYEHQPDAHWPFAFTVHQRFQLSPTTLRLEMEVRNEAPHPAPVGLGWHPYFPKRQRSRLHVEISERWEAGDTKLPTRRVPQPGIDADVAHLDFDHCFDGWTGAARIRDEQLSLRLAASLDRLVVFTPPHEPFFAVEPVSHVNNAINMAEPAQHGLRVVGPGESTSAWMELHIARV
ncbi:aldose 1-epimerase [Ideonella sp. BN130291]|uniref:aldose 1-epimerase n=1 Tax=Ideonella sp. BN130291 TaxID=3112940 RepID=UPI002E25BC23|nr:aldose 1-epimerase [Ideonella sp. BN130291]